MKVLVVASNPRRARFLVRAFLERRDVADAAHRLDDGAKLLAVGSYDVAILDSVSHPKQIPHSATADTRLLALVQDATPARFVELLDGGADDCVPSTCDVRELLARARALARRSRHTDTGALGPLRVDAQSRCARVHGHRVDVTAREVTILGALIARGGSTVSRSEIVEACWNATTENGSNVLDVHILHLRRKLRPLGVRIETVRGLGYRILLGGTAA